MTEINANGKPDKPMITKGMESAQGGLRPGGQRRSWRPNSMNLRPSVLARGQVAHGSENRHSPLICVL